MPAAMAKPARRPRGPERAGATDGYPAAVGSRPLSDVRRLLRVPPPQGRQARAPIFWQVGMAEAVPARIAREWRGELRHHVEIPEQHAIERMGRSHQACPVLREDDLIDQRINRGILDADVIPRSGDVGGLRTPVFTLLVTRGKRL